jgi:hypothetical protein
MSMNSPRELAASMALAVCQINALQPLAADLPALSWDSHAAEDTFSLHGYVRSSYFEPDGTYVSLSAEDEIDVVRAWASSLGSDLHLKKLDRPDLTHEILHLETRTVLESGLKVRVVASLHFSRESDKPAAQAATLTA